jgi:hypothetical protein
MDLIKILASRTVSAFPLSIGTSLAFETLFEGVQAPYDPERKIPERANIQNYNIFMINVETLVRNIIGAVPTHDAESLTPQALLITLEEEINYIIDILNIHDPLKKVKLYFYSRNYTLIKKTFIRSKIVRFYEPHTQKQIILNGQLYGTLKLLRKDKNYDFVNYDLGINLYPKVAETALILTHIPYDLLSYGSFRQLSLLESHTGIIKTKKDFWTKYYDSKKLDLSNIPFQRKLLGIFGDHVMFKPTPMIIRKDVMDLARKCKWTSVSTESKVNLDFNTYMPDIGIRLEYNNI